MASVDSVARILALAADGSSGGGTGGTSNYNDLANKPRINGVELTGNKTLEELGIESGITEAELNAAIATEASARETQDAALQTAINGKLGASNVHAGDNVSIETSGSDIIIHAEQTQVELSTSGDIISLIVSGETIGEIPAPSIQFNGAEAFVAKEVKTFYEETSKVPETVNGVAFGSDVSGGNLSYFTEDNGPYLVLTNRDILNPSNELGGNVIILKDIISSDLPSIELLTIQVDGTTVGTYDGSEATTINIEAATKEYVQELIATINGATFEIVNELPTTDIKTNVIYLVPAQGSGVVGNIYNEYIYIENAWELIGSTSVTVDLENYLAKDNVTSYEPTGNYNPATKKYVDDAIAECKEYVLETIKQATIDGDWWMQI